MKTKKKYLLLFFAAITIVLAGCPPYEPPIHNAYSVTVENIANGTITADPNSNVKEGSTVTLTIIPAEGYQLKPGSLGVQLNNDLVITPTGSETTWEFEMPASNVTVKGEFETFGIPPQTHSVTIDDEITGGTITADPVDAAAGTLVTLVVEPDDETYFLRSGSLRVVPETDPTIIPTFDSETETYTFTMPASAVTVRGIFGSTIPTYRVNIASGITNGTITADLNSGLYGGETITLTITQADGYMLKSGSLSVQASGTDIPLEGSGNTRTFVMPASNVTIRGEFESIGISYSVNIANGMENGTITATPNSDLIGGETITLTITPAEGYKLTQDSLSVQTEAGPVSITESEDTWEFEMPASDVTVHVEFEKKIIVLSGTLDLRVNGWGADTIYIEAYSDSSYTNPVGSTDSSYRVGDYIWHWEITLDEIFSEDTNISFLVEYEVFPIPVTRTVKYDEKTTVKDSPMPDKIELSSNINTSISLKGIADIKINGNYPSYLSVYYLYDEDLYNSGTSINPEGSLLVGLITFDNPVELGIFIMVREFDDELNAYLDFYFDTGVTITVHNTDVEGIVLTGDFYYP